MHHIYHTESFVLASRPTGEDSKTLVLYTRELGLVHARAQALRKLSSKLRYTLQDYSRAQVDLVRGKEVWRITTAVPLDTHSDIRKDIEKGGVLARVASLIARLCAGEDPNPEVFAALVDMVSMLEERSVSAETLRSIELFCVARILIALGYLNRTILSDISEGSVVIPETLSDPVFRKSLLVQINQAMAEAQL